jgi:hypothetical protein
MRNQLQPILKLSFVGIVLAAILMLAGLPGRVMAQQNNGAVSSPAASAIPQIIQFSGQLGGQPDETSGGAARVPAGTVGITFMLFENEQGGTALWSETDNVQVNAQGNYTALLGSASPEGLPMNLFTSVQAHWLAVQPLLQGFGEQPRVLLVSAPYALKAGDAETIGGLPPSAFVRVDASAGASGTIAGTSAGTTTTVATTTQVSNGSAHAKPKRLSTTECGDFCDAGTGYEIGGYLVLTTPAGGGNIVLGIGALATNTTGSNNTASGIGALETNTTGSSNTAIGQSALSSNITASNNTATGYEALNSNTIGASNVASGYQALSSNTTGYYNTASGPSTLYNNTAGSNNTALGYFALPFNTTGSNNIAIGFLAVNNVSGGNSNDIEIGSTGSSGDSGVIRIGTKGTQEKFFVAGVSGKSVGNAIPVMIDSTTGQLGTVSSSRRFKEDIQDMGDSSEGLMRLRPVTFHYKQPFDDGSKPIQYGLVAEEVAEVFPDLVARSADGQIETVKYQLLDPMLLNEVQRQQKEMAHQQSEAQLQQTKIHNLEGVVKTQEALLKTQQAQINAQQTREDEQQAHIAKLTSEMKIVQASLRTRQGSSHARLASAKGTPAAVRAETQSADASVARGGN